MHEAPAATTFPSGLFGSGSVQVPRELGTSTSVKQSVTRPGAHLATWTHQLVCTDFAHLAIWELGRLREDELRAWGPGPDQGISVEAGYSPGNSSTAESSTELRALRTKTRENEAGVTVPPSAAGAAVAPAAS